MSSVSIILPSYNVGAHLRRSLDAVVGECRGTSHDVEVVVVDNNSTDDTVAIAAEFPDVRILRQPKQGSYAARNLGICQSSGEVLIFLDPDCAPRGGWLDAAVTALESPDVAIVLGRRYYGGSRALKLLESYEDEKIQWILRAGAADQVYGYTNNMAMRRALIERFGPFPERARGGDTMFVQRVVRALGAGCVVFAPGMGVDHLEVASLDAYYRKRSIYGASNERLTREVAFRSLSSDQRFRVLMSLVQGRRLSAFDAAALAVLLVPGAIAYDLARSRVR